MNSDDLIFQNHYTNGKLYIEYEKLFSNPDNFGIINFIQSPNMIVFNINDQYEGQKSVSVPKYHKLAKYLEEDKTYNCSRYMINLLIILFDTYFETNNISSDVEIMKEIHKELFRFLPELLSFASENSIIPFFDYCNKIFEISDSFKHYGQSMPKYIRKTKTEDLIKMLNKEYKLTFIDINNEYELLKPCRNKYYRGKLKKEEIQIYRALIDKLKVKNEGKKIYNDLYSIISGFGEKKSVSSVYLYHHAQLPKVMKLDDKYEALANHLIIDNLNIPKCTKQLIKLNFYIAQCNKLTHYPKNCTEEKYNDDEQKDKKYYY